MYKPNPDPSRGHNILSFPGSTPSPVDLINPGDASPELRFSLTKMQLREYGELALGGETEDGDIDTTMYQWTEDERGSRWQLQSLKALDGEAQNWMRCFTPDEVSGGRPRSCVKTLQDLMIYEQRYLPKSSNLNLVPLRNAYLIIEETGLIRWVAPDRKYGVDYTVQVDLDMSLVDPETGIYTPAAPKENSYWQRYITSSLSDVDVREFAQEAISSVLLTKCYEKGIWLFGEGENGKSVMLHLLRQLAPRNTAAIRLSRLVKNEFGSAQLNGKRLALVGEMPTRLSKEIQTVLKGLISRDPSPCEKKGRDEFSFTPKAVWIFATNHHPEISEHEHGFWRKIETIPFTNRVDPSSKVLDLQKVISENPEEMRLFVDWLLVGASRLMKQGRWRTNEEKPEAIQALAYEQRRETDTVVAWLHDCDLRFETGVLTCKKKIYEVYREHVIDCGRHPVAYNKFWGRLKENFRAFNFDPEGEQRKISGKRQRCVSLLLEGTPADFQIKKKPALVDVSETAEKANIDALPPIKLPVLDSSVISW